MNSLKSACSIIVFILDIGFRLLLLKVGYAYDK